MNRHFTLPAVIACSVHATLLFAFPSSPPVTRKVTAAEKLEYKQWELKPAEEKPDDLPPDPGASAPGGKPQIAPPSNPEPLPAKVPLDGMPMERNAEITPRIDVKTDTIPKGPFSSHGVVDGNPFSDGNGPMVFNPSSLDRGPRTRMQAEPVYPPAMKAAGLTGEVVVQFTVDESGTVLNPRVIRSSHRDFEEPTLRAVSRWRFEPGTKNMKPVRFIMTVPVVFSVGE